MQTNRLTLRLLHATLAAVWLVALAGNLSSQEPAAKVTVLEVAGQVDVMRAGAVVWDPARPGQQLFPGDRLKTGPRSRATLQLSDRTVLRVDKDSYLQVPTGPRKRSPFEFFRGIFYFFHRDKPDEFWIKTPTVSAVIRGTEFVLQIAEADGETVVGLFDGAVAMTNELGALEVQSPNWAATKPNQAPAATAALDAVNVIQWGLYYPGVAHLDELGLSAEEQAALADSITAYRGGDLLLALAQYPAGRVPASNADKVFRAALLLAVGRVDEANALLDALDPATRGEPAALIGESLRKLIAAVKFQKSPDTRAPALASEWLAESYYRQSQSTLDGALQRAREAAWQAVTVAPEFGFGWARVAELEFSFGQADHALRSLEQAVQLSPLNPQAIALKGFLLSAQNKYAEAINFFDQAINLDAALGNAWLGRGLCKIRLGRLEEGLQDIQVAATVEPQRAILRSYLGKAFSQTRGEYKRAAHELELARQKDPNDPTAWLYSALLNQQGNRINEAVRDLEHSQQLNDNRALYRSRLLLVQDRAVRGANLANIYRDAGMTDVSVREAARAVSADYSSYSAHLFLASSYYDPRQVNLRYESPRVNEYLLANLLAPAEAGTLSPTISQQEYSKLFESDRVGFASSTEYFSTGDWRESAAQYGLLGNLSYSLEAFHRVDAGARVNSDLQSTSLSFQLKQQITSSDSIYFQTIYADAKGGRLGQRYDPTAAGLASTYRFRENQEPLAVFGYHREWVPGVHTLFLAGRLHDKLQTTNAVAGLPVVDTSAFPSILSLAPSQSYASELELYTAEAQQILHRGRHGLTLGGRFQTGRFQSRNQFDFAPVLANFPFFDPTPTTNQNFSQEFERLNAYAYYNVQPIDALLLTVGVSYDRLIFPENFRYAPLSASLRATDRLSPKAGVIWSVREDTTLRAAYTRSLGGVSFDQSFQLEPTQVGGFNQAFRSGIPDSVAGANAAERFESAAVALDQKFPTRTYAGLTAEVLKSGVSRQFGALESSFTGELFPLLLRENLNFKEQSFTASLNQLAGDHWSFGARYRVSRARLEDSFPGVSSSVPRDPSVTPDFLKPQALVATLQRAELYAIFNSPCGWFAEADGIWSMQHNKGYSTPLPGDEFWQFNASVGWRSPRRRAEVRLGVLNIFDRDYRLNPLNLTPDLPRERTLAASLKFFF